MKRIVLAVLLFLCTRFVFGQSYDFDLQDINGNDVKLSALLAKGPVLLQFWATWCIPCKEEMKVLNDLWGKYKDSGFGYVALSIDDSKSMSKVKPFIDSKGYTFTTVFDTDKNVFSTFGGQDPPFSVLLSKSGAVLKTYYGYVTGDQSALDADIQNALGSSGKN